MEAPESITKYLASGFVEEGAGIAQASACVRGVSWSEVATLPKLEVAQGVGPGPLVEL